MEGARQVVDDVGGCQTDFAQLLCRYVACQAVNIYAEEAGVLGHIALGEQRKDDACQHIATASCGHAAVARGIEEYAALRRTDGGVVALQHHVALVAGSNLQRFEER